MPGQERIRYPRTPHLMWSPGATSDDRVLKTTASWEGTEVVITEKMDGSQCTLYCDGLHGRSLELDSHWQWDKLKAMHAAMSHEIPVGWRICLENMTAVHSIEYDNLPSLFLVFSTWDRDNICLGWVETTEWCALLDLTPVPVLYQGLYTDDACKALCDSLDTNHQEGLVVRPANRFHFDRFSVLTGKWVRKNHVRTSDHWKEQPPRYNRTRHIEFNEVQE